MVSNTLANDVTLQLLQYQGQHLICQGGLQMLEGDRQKLLISSVMKHLCLVLQNMECYKIGNHFINHSKCIWWLSNSGLHVYILGKHEVITF